MPHETFPHDRVQRAVHRATVVAEKAAHRGRPPAFLGLVLVAMGVLFLLDNLNIVEGRYLLRTYWPTLIIAWGLLRLAFGHGAARVLGLLVAAVGCVVLANSVMGWGVRAWDLFWPLALIAFGLHLLVQATMPRARWQAEWANIPPPPDVDDESRQPPPLPDTAAYIRESAITSSVERRNTSQAFRGGELTALMGSLELDLRECRIAEDLAELSIFVNLGNVELRIPRDWRVESHLSLVLANFENNTTPPVDAASKLLVLRGYAVLGNVEIGN